MPSTQAILDHHLQCIGACDLDGILVDYAAHSVILTTEGALRGLDAIRTFFARAFAEFSQPGTTFTMKTVIVEGDCAFIVWDAETVDNWFEAASDTFVVREGRIVLQTYAAKVTAKNTAPTPSADEYERSKTHRTV